MKRRRRPAVILIVCAAVLVAAGILAGQPGQVYSKAAQICMECIGLG